MHRERVQKSGKSTTVKTTFHSRLIAAAFKNDNVLTEISALAQPNCLLFNKNDVARHQSVPHAMTITVIVMILREMLVLDGEEGAIL